MTVPPLPPKSSVSLDENNNIPEGTSEGSFKTNANLGVGEDPTERFKSNLKSAYPLNIDRIGRKQNQNIITDNEILDVQQNLCRRRGLNYVAKNASEINLAQIREDNHIDSITLDSAERCLVRLAKLLMVSGLTMLLFIVVMSTLNSAVFDFLREYFVHHQMLFIFFVGSIMHPPVVGIYCLFTLQAALSHVRPYFLRVPFTLIFPVGFLATSIQYFCNIPSLMESYLIQEMKNYLEYTDSAFTWDSLHKLLSCCGINSSKDWIPILNATEKSIYPRSCCILDEPGCPNFELSTALYSEGCLTPVTNLQLAIAGSMIFMAVVQAILLVMSIYFMRKLHNLIQSEIQDTRSTWKIIFGKFYSICESEEYDDEQQELAEQEQTEFYDFVKSLPTTFPRPQRYLTSSTSLDENRNELTKKYNS